MERVVARGGASRPFVAGFSGGTRVETAPCAGRVPQIKHGQRQGGRCTKVYGPCKTLRKHTPCATSGASSSSANVTQKQPDGFDIKQITTIGGCAFSAYQSPDCGLPALTFKKETNAYFATSPLLFKETMKSVNGLLQIELISASGLENKDTEEEEDKSDPFTVLRVGEDFRQSNVISDDLSPEWGERFTFFVKDVDKQTLEIQVNDSNKKLIMGSDPSDDLGSVNYPLENLKDGELHTEMLKLDGKQDGTVTFSAKYIPFEENKAEVLSSIYGDESADPENPIASITGVLTEWQKLAKKAGKSTEDLFVPVFYIENILTDTQAWVYRSNPKHDRKEIVISFRGTSKLEDIISDLNFPHKNLDGSLPDIVEIFGAGNKINTHSGFTDAYDSVKACIPSIIDLITEGSSDWKVNVTGHSLGGALATLCAFDLTTRKDAVANVDVFTYGCPRVGNKAFALAFNKVLPKGWRVSNEKDPVTNMPHLANYYHCGENVILSEKNVSFGGRSDDGARIVWAVLGGFLGIKHHEGDMYFAWLKEAVDRVRGRK
ncbi:hypothetical protein BSKO_01547 [Bryopsis sp. KO-2023]|nr:hypothetical protein BSKO_01547 [Bryopsis sp. KO-2023]